MLELTINKNCDGCGACELNLPGLHKSLNNGHMKINPYNPNVDWEAISDALKYCESGALQLEEL